MGARKMGCQVEKLEHFGHILLFEFNTGAKAEKAARNMCAMYGDSAIGESTSRKLFSRFACIFEVLGCVDISGHWRP